jgi:hypothetical protein
MPTLLIDVSDATRLFNYKAEEFLASEFPRILRQAFKGEQLHVFD